MTLPDVLIDADWVQAHLDDPGVVLVEIAEDPSSYAKGHIKGAVMLDRKQDLEDPVTRGFIDQARFQALLSERGIASRDTVILYSDRGNFYAAYAFWYFKVYGHRSVRLLDGGRARWELDSRQMVTDVPRRPATVYRAQKPERWVRMVIRARSRGTWSPRRRRWPWRPVTRRPAASGLGPSQPLQAGAPRTHRARLSPGR